MKESPMTQYTDLGEQADKALEGVTEGPWFPGGVNGGGRPTLVYCDDATGSAVADTVLQFVHRREGECEANANFMAFTRAWVPAAAAAIRELEACNAILTNLAIEAERVATYEKASADAAEAKVARLEGALTRQGDNMAFVINHANLPDQWEDKFTLELAQDRAALKGEANG
jgi:hypothetical protein